jgi:hypothetical protein
MKIQLKMWNQTSFAGFRHFRIHSRWKERRFLPVSCCMDPVSPLGVFCVGLLIEWWPYVRTHLLYLGKNKCKPKQPRHLISRPQNADSNFVLALKLRYFRRFRH